MTVEFVRMSPVGAPDLEWIVGAPFVYSMFVFPIASRSSEFEFRPVTLRVLKVGILDLKAIRYRIQKANPKQRHVTCFDHTYIAKYLNSRMVAGTLDHFDATIVRRQFTHERLDFVPTVKPTATRLFYRTPIPEHQWTNHIDVGDYLALYQNREYLYVFPIPAPVFEYIAHIPLFPGRPGNNSFASATADGVQGWLGSQDEELP